jgi:hypothetical protein
MKKHVLALACLVLLSGCDSMDGLFNSEPDEDMAPAPQAAQAAAPAASTHDAFCRAIAQQDATGFDFDTATQQRVAQHSYAQCLSIYGG